MIKYLYIIFLIHLFALEEASLALLYGVLLLFIVNRKDVVKNKMQFLILGLIFSLNVLLIPFVGVCWRELALLMWFLLLLVYFRNKNISIREFVKFVNNTYVCYLFLSVLVTFHIIQPGFTGEEMNQFDIDVGNSTMTTLVGFSGTTAAIDSYSSIVLLINLLFSTGKIRLLFSSISLLAMLLTFRFTPLVAMGFASSVIFLRENKLITLYKLFVVTFCAFSFFVPLFYIEDLDFLDEITHSRAKIWIEYWYIWISSGISSMLFGIRQQHLPEIIFTESQGWFSNPHSSFMRIFLFWGTLFYFVFVVYLYKVVLRILNKKNLAIVSLVLVCAVTNSIVLWNENPIYILCLVYFTYNMAIDDETVKEDVKLVDISRDGVN